MAMHGEKLFNTVGASSNRIANIRVDMTNVNNGYNSPGRGYDHLPTRIATGAPWNEVPLELVGPWIIKLKIRSKNKTYEFMTLSAIAP